MRNGKFWLWSLVILLFSLLSELSVQAAPSALTYQGRILKSDGTPLQHSSVSFQFEITNPTGSCVLYREQVNGVNMVHSQGLFDIKIGTSHSFPSSPSFKLLDAFSNAGTMTCDGGALFTPGIYDGRLLRVSFYDGTSWKVISPDSVIRSVPYAAFSYSAAKLGSYEANEYILRREINNDVTCDSGSFLTWNASTRTFGCAAASSGGGGGGGAGLLTLNGQSGSAQTLAPTSSATTYGFSSAGNAHTLVIPSASTAGVTAGTISKADYDNFSAKQNALGFTPLNRASNLSDLADAATARTHLGLGSAATLNTGTTAGLIPLIGVGDKLSASLLPDFTASTVTHTPAGTLTATTVQGALGELDTLKVSKSGDTMTGPLHLPSEGLVVGTSQLVTTSAGVGIGTTTPFSEFHLVGATTIDQFSDNNNGAGGTYRKARGTASAPTAALSGDRLLGLYARGHNGTDFGVVNVGAIQIRAAEDFTPTANGTYIDFGTTPLGSTTRQTRMILSDSGNVGIGTATPSAKLDVEGAIQISYNSEACAVAGDAGTIRYSGGVLQYCNGSAWQTLGVSGAGLTTLNSQTGSSQTFGTPGTSGTAPAWSSASNVHTLNIPMASAAGVTAGLLSKTDYDAFNAKLGTASTFSGDVTGTSAATSVGRLRGTTVSATAPTSAGQVLRYDGASSYVPAFLSLADIRSSLTPTNTMFPSATCTAAQTLTWSSLTDTMSCTSISLAATQLTSGTLPVARLPALTGDVTSSAGSATTTIANNAITSAKILDNTITSADLANSISDALWTTTGGHVYRSGGNVGVGSTSPTYKLQVEGTGKFAGNLEIASGSDPASPPLSFVGDTDTGIYRPAANQLAISTAGTMSALFDAAGNINLVGNLGVRDASPSSNVAINSLLTVGANANRYGLNNNLVLDSSAALTANRSAYGAVNDVVSSMTSANLAGFTQTLYGALNRARTGAGVGEVGTATTAFGAYNQTVHQATTALPTAYGSYNIVSNSSTSTNINAAAGVFGYVNQGNTTTGMTTAYGVRSQVTNSNTGAGAIGTGYLYHGQFTGTGTVTNKYGIYLTGETDNYMSGSLELGNNLTHAGTYYSTMATTGMATSYIGYQDTNNRGLQIMAYGTSHAGSPKRTLIYANYSGGTNSTGGSLDFNTPNEYLRISPPGGSNGVLQLFTGNSLSMLIEANGNTGIGYSSPQEKLAVNGNIIVNGNHIYFSHDGATDTNNDYLSYDDTNATYHPSNKGFFIIDSDQKRGSETWESPTAGLSAYVGYFKAAASVGTIARNGTLTVGGNIVPAASGDGNIGTSSFRWNTIYANNGTISTSDRRLKENIQDLKPGLDFILSLRPVSYKWRSEANADERVHWGLIAQEIKESVDHYESAETGVVNKGDGEFYGVNYSEIVSPIIKAISELYHKWLEDHHRIDQLEQENRTLRAELDQQKAELKEVVNQLQSQGLLRQPASR